MQAKNGKETLNNPSQTTGPHRDRQGNDKAPGEEDREGSIENTVADTQRGQAKEDGDPSQPTDGAAPQP